MVLGCLVSHSLGSFSVAINCKDGIMVGGNSSFNAENPSLNLDITAKTSDNASVEISRAVVNSLTGKPEVGSALPNANKDCFCTHPADETSQLTLKHNLNQISLYGANVCIGSASANRILYTVKPQEPTQKWFNFIMNLLKAP